MATYLPEQSVPCRDQDQPLQASLEGLPGDTVRGSSPVFETGGGGGPFLGVHGHPSSSPFHPSTFCSHLEVGRREGWGRWPGPSRCGPEESDS